MENENEKNVFIVPGNHKRIDDYDYPAGMRGIKAKINYVLELGFNALASAQQGDGTSGRQRK